MFRYEDDETFTLVASWGELPAKVPIGTRFPLGGHNISSRVFRTAAPARIDNYAEATGVAGTRGRAEGVRSAAGAPIIVDGSLWGAMLAAAAEPLPEDTESRMVGFTELVATAIANTDARLELTASRARIAAAADVERRRVVRDLHDGAQQRLVHTIITLKQARQMLQAKQEPASELVAEALAQAELATEELRELAQGLLPAVLRHGGLRAGIRALVARTPVPVEVDVSVDRLPEPVEATAYFVVAEALTNVAKHARATGATVLVHVEDNTLRIQVRDDGAGGARPDGSGLVGLADRLAVFDGHFRIESPTGGGTLLAAEIPLRG
jgi:signal transduction histidine kinase